MQYTCIQHITAIEELLQSAEKIVITTHINPDGDAIGSTLALYDFLVNNGKIVHAYISESAVPANMKFLNNSNKIKKYVPEQHDKYIYSADAIFLLDLNSIDRVKTMGAAIQKSTARKVMIDHHIAPENIADIFFVDSIASSTGELMYSLLKNLKSFGNSNINKNIAEAIYTAIITDTGNFRFNNTSARVFSVASELISLGVTPSDIYDIVYNQNSINSSKLLGLAYSSIEQVLDNKVVFMSISDEMLKQTGTTDADVEGFSDKTLTLKGAVVGVLFVELSHKNEIRISMRSRSGVNIREIAAKYSGGGHANAAGLRLHEMTLDEAKKIIFEELKNLISLIKSN